MPVTHFAWLIEYGPSSPSAPEYWCGTEGAGDGLVNRWLKRSDDAIRFARREDAVRVARCLIDDDQHPTVWRVSEHGWDGGLSTDTSHSNEQSAQGLSDREAMVRLSASEVACYRWPEDTAEHRAARAAFMDGAASMVRP